MELRLYSFSKKHNSTKQLPSDITPLATFSDFNLKQNTDLDNPTFLIDDQLRGANYAYLVDLGRYYFINKYRLGNNYIYEIECELDALATYKTNVLAYTAFVERCSDSSHYRENFNDPLVSVSQNVSEFSMETAPISEFSSNNGCYVLRIAGGDADGVSTFVTDNLAALAPIFDTQTYLASDAQWFEKFGNLVFNPWDYIVAFYWSPLKLNFYTSEGAYLTDIYVKWVNTGARAYKLPNNKVAYAGTDAIPRPLAIYGDFRKYNPNFTRYKMFIPAVGLVDLDNNEADGSLQVTYTIALDTGGATVDLMRVSDLTRLAHFNAQLYTPLQGATDRWDVGQIVTDVASAAAGFIGGNVGGGVAGAISAVGNIVKPTPQMLGSAGGIGVRADTSVYFISECFQSGTIPTAVAGRPCFRNLLLSTLSGFVKCGGASLDVAANESVKLRLNAFLNEGFYIE